MGIAELTTTVASKSYEDIKPKSLKFVGTLNTIPVANKDDKKESKIRDTLTNSVLETTAQPTTVTTTEKQITKKSTNPTQSTTTTTTQSTTPTQSTTKRESTTTPTQPTTTTAQSTTIT